MIEFVFNENSEVMLRFTKESCKNETVRKLKDNKLLKFDSLNFYNDLDIDNKGNIYITYIEGEDLEEVRVLGYNVSNELLKRNITNAMIDTHPFKNEDFLLAFLEGLMHAHYNFDHYKSKKSENALTKISLNNLIIDEDKITELTTLVKATFMARDFVNLTPIDLYPESYANMINDLFKDSNVDVEILNKSDLEKLNMHALLSVNMGSFHEAKFVKLSYMPNKDTNEHITFVGKGVTYDSGGLALKNASGMASMKSDMAGSAAVVGAMKAISDNNLNINVVVVTALTENLVDAKSYKNGDVISSMKGLSIEINNTDAEGRLTLADAIYYSATKLNSTKIIEISTLTGACVVALGNHITGVITKDDNLYNELHEAGLLTGEFNWRLPITKQLKSLVKGSISDLKNAVAGGAGASTAGIFLTHFSEDIPFAHLDIAGPSFTSSHKYYKAGASGVGVRTLYRFAKNQIK